MGNFNGLAKPLNHPITALVVHAATAQDMQTKVNQAVAAFVTANMGILDLELIGCGDGHQFAVMIHGAPGAPAAAFDSVIAYEGAGGSELQVAATAAVAAAANAVPVALQIAAVALAGSAKGQRFMGMLLVGTPR